MPGANGIPLSLLYNFELNVHRLGWFSATPPKGGRLLLVFRLWDFPPLTVECCKDGVIAGSGVAVIELGKNCMFEGSSSDVGKALPLELVVLLVDDRNGRKRVLAKNSTTVGSTCDQAATLKTARNNIEIPLLDTMDTPFCIATVSYLLNAVGPYYKDQNPSTAKPAQYVQYKAEEGRPSVPLEDVSTADTIGGFIRKEVLSQLSSCIDSLLRYDDVEDLAVDDVVRGAGAGVFARQIGLIQQLQHNTSKLASVVEEAYYKKHGIRKQTIPSNDDSPAKRIPKKTKKPKKKKMHKVKLTPEMAAKLALAGGGVNISSVIPVVLAAVVANSAFQVLSPDLLALTGGRSSNFGLTSPAEPARSKSPLIGVPVQDRKDSISSQHDLELTGYSNFEVDEGSVVCHSTEISEFSDPE
eukprot:TRINITY_DN339_c7_g1_i1.p1 TRINITY_DN339_c7_g1~~TRINITY_DN339_c7_g1_i1.p1  ORF type:complete len:420 (+),score=100.06 TRINITY_DN339_c7_g1_i1:27-1262(+)